MVSGFNGITTMQEMVASVCHSAPFGEEGQLTDARDSKSYWVAKLNDGNCWMTQNLDLDIPANGLSKNDTDIPVDWNSSSTYKPEATQVTASPSFDTTNNNIKSWDPAQGEAEKYCVDSKCNSTSVTSSNDGHDAQGNYYSWGAATAGQATNITGAGQATQSICPKGWKLPTSGSGGEFQNAFNGLSVAAITTVPYYFVYGGVVDSRSLASVGSLGYYWSSTATSGTNAYGLGFDTGVKPSYDNYRYRGCSVRCVAR